MIVKRTVWLIQCGVNGARGSHCGGKVVSDSSGMSKSCSHRNLRSFVKRDYRSYSGCPLNCVIEWALW